MRGPSELSARLRNCKRASNVAFPKPALMLLTFAINEVALSGVEFGLSAILHVLVFERRGRAGRVPAQQNG